MKLFTLCNVRSHRCVSTPALVSANKPLVSPSHLPVTPDLEADCCIVHDIKDSADFLKQRSPSQMSTTIS